MGPNCVDSWETFAKAFSRTEGNWRKRRVCPVGAVSKTIVSYLSSLTCLRTSANDMASSIPGICRVLAVHCSLLKLNLQHMPYLARNLPYQQQDLLHPPPRP